MTTGCARSISRSNRSGFSLVELLVVVAVIGIISAIALPNILNARSSALDSAISLQEKNLNSVYKSVKAATVEMPTEQAAILSFLATNSKATFVPPTTMEGPEGTLTLAYNLATDDFSYNSSGDSPPSEWNPQGAFVPDLEFQNDKGEDVAFYDTRNDPTLPGEEDYFSPGGGGLQFETFRLNVDAGGYGTITTQSGNTFTIDPDNPESDYIQQGSHKFSYIQAGDHKIYWELMGSSNDGIKILSVVNSPAET